MRLHAMVNLYWQTALCLAFLGSGAAASPDGASQVAQTVGRAVGAASSCPEIENRRIVGIVGRLNAASSKLGATAADNKTIRDAYDQGVAEGQRAIGGGLTDCAAVARDVARWETAEIDLAAPPAPSIVAVVPPPPRPALAHGVTESEIRFGLVASFSGPSKTYGREILVGIQAAFGVVNESGGLYGRKLQLVSKDDGFNPAQTVEIVKHLYENENIFGFVGNFGTQTTAAVLPYLLQRRVLLFAPYVGATLVRRDPPDRYVFTFRPGGGDETAAGVQYLMKIKRFSPQQIAVFAQGDGYGAYAYDGAQKAVRRLRPNVSTQS